MTTHILPKNNSLFISSDAIITATIIVIIIRIILIIIIISGKERGRFIMNFSGYVRKINYITTQRNLLVFLYR